MTPCNSKVCLLVFLALPKFVHAFNHTNFAYFKNTNLRPCDPSKFLTNQSSFIPLDAMSAGSGFAYSTRYLTSIEFCDSFWNYTVIPTMPNDAAFAFTWLSCLSNCISFLISSLLLYLSAARHGTSETEHARPSIPVYVTNRAYLIKPLPPAPHSTNPGIRRIFWATLLYDSIKTVSWWFSFYRLVRSSSTASRISLLQWITTYQYRITLRDTLRKERRWLRWPPLAISVLQFGCSIYAASIMAQTLPLPVDGEGTFTTVTYQLTQDPFFSPFGVSPCSHADAARAVLLFDPAAPVRQMIYFIGSLIAAILFIPSIVLEIRGGTTRRFMWAYQVYATGAVQGTMALVLALVRWRSTPLSWDERCAAVHIMMSPNVGYWDAEMARLWRVFKAWFNV